MAIQQRATLEDVARLAGVSSKTVSRVFSNRELVAPKTVEVVLKAAQRLRFRPNTLARNLRRGGVTNTMGFVMGELLNPFYFTVAAGIERELADAGYTLLVATTEDTPEGEQRVVDSLLAQRVRALLMIPVADDQSYLEGERQLGTPLVAIDRPARDLVADSVVLENYRGTWEATRALLARGHQRIGYVCNPASVYTQVERVRGYREALAAAGIPDSRAWERLLDDPGESVERAVLSLLDSETPPTAIIAGNNRACIAAMRALNSRDRQVALIGFDDFDTADVLGVTVIAHDPLEMGRRAARLALERIDDPTAFISEVRLPTWVVPRGTGERPPVD